MSEERGFNLEEQIQQMVNDMEENEEMLRQEREMSTNPEPPVPIDSAPPPDIVWQGPWGEVAHALGIWDWRVWVGVTAAVSAIANRRISANYHGPFYGMGHWLLVAPTGSGKSLTTLIAQSLMPISYRQRSSVESGPALVESLAEFEHDKKGKVVKTTPVPCLLNMSEWTGFLQAASYRNANLIEKFNEIADARYRIEIVRTINSKAGGVLSIPEPTLTTCATTTIRSYQKYTQEYMAESGFINRYLHLPGPTIKRQFNSPQQYLDLERLERVGFLLNDGHGFGFGKVMHSLYEPRALAVEEVYGETLMDDDGSVEYQIIARHHAYLRRIAMLYAWAEKVEKIGLSHVEAAIAVVTESRRFVVQLWNDAPVQLTQTMQVGHAIEAKILAKIRERPGITKQDLCRALHRHGGYPVIAEHLDKLLIAKAIYTKKIGTTPHVKVGFFVRD